MYPPPIPLEQLLIGVADEKWRPALVDVFVFVPRTLWRLSRRSESLMLAPESSRSPGSAFVEEDGATSALAQAMLIIVFRMVRLGHERGLLVVQGGGAIEPIDGRERKSDDDRDRRDSHHPGEKGAVLASVARRGRSQTLSRRPWRTIVQVLTATVAGSAGGVSHLGFAGRLVQLFCDQDDALVDMLLTNLHIFLNVRPRVSHLAPRPLMRVAAVARAMFDIFFFVCVHLRDFGMKADELVGPGGFSHVWLNRNVQRPL